MRSINNRLNWASAVTFSVLVVGCTVENVPIGENDGAGTGSKGSVDEVPSDEGSGATDGTDVDPGDPAYGSGAAGGTDVDPGDPAYGSGAAGGTDVDPGDPAYGSGAAGGTDVDPGDPAYGSGAAGETDVDPGDPAYGSGAAGGTEVQNPVVTAYCEMEATCLSSCEMEDGVVPCGAPERQDECKQIELPMNSPCEIAEAQWLECMAHSSCDEVQLFFASYPDNIQPTTPCGEGVDQFCDDWAPPTDYGFN